MYVIASKIIATTTNRMGTALFKGKFDRLMVVGKLSSIAGFSIA